MEKPYTPVKRQDRLSAQVCEQIQALIRAQELVPGDRLPTERELCERFQVSRTVVREAIRILEARRLVETQGGSGTYVKALEANDVAQSLGISPATSETGTYKTQTEALLHGPYREWLRLMQAGLDDRKAYP